MQKVLMRRTYPISRFMLSVLFPFAIGLLLFIFLMRPSLSDFGLMTALMGGTTILSILLSYAAYRLDWFTRFPQLRYALMGSYLLAGVLVFLNVWVIANLMFANEHDLLLATILLVFASGIASMAGFFLSTALTERIELVSQAAERLAEGQFTARVKVSGRDEMAQLAGAFNRMAAQLELSAGKQREAETIRRDLIAWVGHDLRTPLSSIRAVLEALADGVVEDPLVIQRYLKTAQQDIRALSHLIDELFELSQLDAGGLQLDVHPESLSDLISDTIESFTHIAKEQGIVLEGTAQPGLDPVHIDMPRMGRVLNNLVSNALRHTPAGGKVSIHAVRSEGTINIDISDTGEGIRAEDIAHVFDRFHRGEKSRSRSTGGSGLGLAIAKGIVEAHGGTIEAKSVPGQETKFSIRLPE